MSGRVCEAAGLNLPCSSGTTMQRGMGAGRSKFYPSESARTLLKECFAGNPPVQLDPPQQLTGMSSDQMIQFARAVGLEISLTTFKMLEDKLLKIDGKAGRNVGDKSSGQSGPFSRTGPGNLLKNRHCFYCMICRRNVSMKSEGLYEPKRHFQREHHLRADQRFRARYHPSKVSGSDGRTLYGSKLEAEKEFFMHLEVPELDHKRPFFYDVLEGKPFTFTSASSRTLIQFE